MHAAVYDADGNYIQDVPVDWTSIGTLDEVSFSGESFIFNPLTPSTNGSIEVSNESLILDQTGIITVINPPIINYNSGSISPNIISAGNPVNFEISVVNNGDLGVTLDTLSELIITNGQSNYIANLGELTILNPGSIMTLEFQENTIPNDLLPGFYTPKLNLSGIDADSSVFRQDNLLLDQNSITIVGMEINDVI